MFSSVHSCNETRGLRDGPGGSVSPPTPRVSPYLADLLQPPQHEAVVADGGTEEFGHQAEADAQGQLLLEGQALGVEESPVIWGRKHRGCVGGCAARGRSRGLRRRSPPNAPQLQGKVEAGGVGSLPCTLWSRDIQ